MNKRYFFNILRCLCAITALWTSSSISRAGGFEYDVSFDTSSLALKLSVAPDEQTYTEIQWNEMESVTEAGAPALPMSHLRFLVPTYCRNLRISLKNAEQSTFRKLLSPPQPVQEAVPGNESEYVRFTAPDKDAYQSRYANPEVKIIEDSFIDGFRHVVTVAVRPIAYSSDNGVLQSYSSLSFRLDYDECGVEEMDVKPIVPQRYSPFFTMGNDIIDPLGLTRINERQKSVAKVSEYTSTDYYYVITTENLKDALDDFVIWKAQKGYTVVVKTIEEILATPRYAVNPSNTVQGNVLVDEAASLRAYLTDEYQKNGFFYCLLVGDYRTSMPIRKATYSSLDRSNDNAEGMVPTDTYFTDLIANWNLNIPNNLSLFADATYNVFKSFNPCISTSRLLCYNHEDIQKWFAKLKIYEANPGYGDNSYLKEALFFEQYAKGTSNLINNSVIVRNVLSDKLNCKLIQDRHASDNSKWGPFGAEMVRELSKVGFSSWHGHGNPCGIACAYGTYYVTSEDSVYGRISQLSPSTKDERDNGLDNMTNHYRPSVVYSISCSNNPFDYIMHNDGKSMECKYNLGAAFTVGSRDIGGPVFLGYTRPGYVEYSKYLERSFFEGILNNPKIGYAENYSKLHSNNVKHIDYLRGTHSIIGDSELNMWLGQPKVNNTTIRQNNSIISLIGGDLIGSKVTAYDGLGNTAVLSDSVTGSNFSYTIAKLPGTFDKSDFIISVWKPDYLPLIKYFGQNATLTNCSKSFIVRDAIFGSSVMPTKTSGDFTIGNGANLNLQAIDGITTQNGFVIDKGGSANLCCDISVNLNGGNIKKGGKMTVKCNDIEIAGGFSVEEGAELSLFTETQSR